MRTLFIAVSKVFGLLQVYFGLSYMITIIMTMRMMEQTPSAAGVETAFQTPSGSIIALTAGSVTGMFLLTFGMAWLLVFRAEWLADKLKIPAQDDHSPLSSDAILGAGARLLALFIIVQSAPELLKATTQAISHAIWSMDTHNLMTETAFRQSLFYGVLVPVLPPALKLFMGLFLAFRTQKVLAFMDRTKK
jgi:hypothetical protein